MTKYFTYVKNNSVTQYGLLPIRDVSGKTYHCQGVIDKLNELHEENRRLQRHLDVMRSGALTDDKRIKELYEENEQLKNNIKEAYENERTALGRSVLKQLLKQME